jgi:DUF4097 and DUF4098 domain-containing protein YvlB
MLMCFAASGQDRITVPLSDPSRPATVRANLVQGGISVVAYDGKEIVVEANRRGERREREDVPDDARGMRVISLGGTSLRATEENNVVRIDTGFPNKTVDLTVRVPRETSLKLGTVNGGDISIEGVSGEIEANNVNGSVSVTDVSGLVVASTVNGGVNVTFRSVTANKLMSFSTLNGKIDVTFPPGVKATVKLESEHGKVYTDFDITMQSRPREPVVEERQEGRGRYRVSTQNAIYGDINGGGPEYQFKTVNGSIYIRKAQ